MKKEKEITKALVLEVLGKINEKDFLRVIESVENACLEDEKAKKQYNSLNPRTVTYSDYIAASQRVKVCSAVKTAKLKEFFDLFTQRVKTFNGLSVVRKELAEIKKIEEVKE